VRMHEPLSESRMREIGTFGSTSWEWKRSTVSYSGIGNRKGRPTRKAHLNRHATPRLYVFSASPFLLVSALITELWCVRSFHHLFVFASR